MPKNFFTVKRDGLYCSHAALPPWKKPTDDVRHSHSGCELIYLVHGDMTHVIEGRRYKLRPGDLVLVRPGRYHDIRFDSDREYERYNILFDIEELGLWRAAAVSDRFEVISLSDRPEIAALFTRMDVYAATLSEEDFAREVAHLLAVLFCDLSFLPPEEERRHAHQHPLLSEALTYIKGNLFTVQDVTEIAAALHVTESYLFRLFRTELGVGPKHYITEKRLLAAQSYIRLGRRPSEVFAECGFADYSSFFRAYKKLFGSSPSEG